MSNEVVDLPVLAEILAERRTGLLFLRSVFGVFTMRLSVSLSTVMSVEIAVAWILVIFC